MSLSFSSAARARLRDRPEPNAPDINGGLASGDVSPSLPPLYAVPLDVGWHHFGDRVVYRMGRSPSTLLSFVTEMRDSPDFGSRLVTLMLPAGVSPGKFAGELNELSDLNIHVAEHNDLYLHEMLIAR